MVVDKLWLVTKKGCSVNRKRLKLFQPGVLRDRLGFYASSWCYKLNNTISKIMNHRFRGAAHQYLGMTFKVFWIFFRIPFGLRRLVQFSFICDRSVYFECKGTDCHYFWTIIRVFVETFVYRIARPVGSLIPQIKVACLATFLAFCPEKG